MSYRSKKSVKEIETRREAQGEEKERVVDVLECVVLQKGKSIRQSQNEGGSKKSNSLKKKAHGNSRAVSNISRAIAPKAIMG